MAGEVLGIDSRFGGDSLSFCAKRPLDKEESINVCQSGLPVERVSIRIRI